MTVLEEIAPRLADFLALEIESTRCNGRTMVLTPAEYPDCDAVAVVIERGADGLFVVTDSAEADAHLIGFLGDKNAQARAELIASRFDVSFHGGRVVARVIDHELPEACWRVAQASAAIAEGSTFLNPVATPRPTFDDLVWRTIQPNVKSIRRNVPLRGLSGHEHRASIFIPSTEAVVEPIAGQKAWERATRVYAEFGDLRQANGYRLVAVLDDRVAGRHDELAKLLSQVGQVALWTRQADWLTRVTTPNR